MSVSEAVVHGRSATTAESIYKVADGWFRTWSAYVECDVRLVSAFIHRENQYIAFDTLPSKLFRKLNESENKLLLCLHSGFVKVLRISKPIKVFFIVLFGFHLNCLFFTLQIPLYFYFLDIILKPHNMCVLLVRCVDYHLN